MRRFEPLKSKELINISNTIAVSRASIWYLALCWIYNFFIFLAWHITQHSISWYILPHLNHWSTDQVTYDWSQGSWNQHGTHLGPVGPWWVPCSPPEPCYPGCMIDDLLPSMVLDNHLPRKSTSSSLQWRHNERDSVSNHQPHDCLLNRLFRCRSKKTSKLRVTGLCEGNSPVTGEFPSQRASNADNISIWLRHRVLGQTLTVNTSRQVYALCYIH